MTLEHRVTTREDKAVAIYELETHFAMAVRQRELLEQYIKDRLKPGQHYYTIDDELGRKPSLTKEGAELICLPHALKPHYSWLSGTDNPPLDDTPYQITMQCELETNGKFAGGGVGSANSMITKKDGSRVQRQKDPGLRHNATVKMACKSAYIAATLNATAASEFFTQDLEDDQTGTGAKPDKRGHFCKEHNAVFFRKGKMENYAHPIKGQPGQWCNEPEAVVVEGTAIVQEATEPPAPVKVEATDQAKGGPPAEEPPVENAPHSGDDGFNALKSASAHGDSVSPPTPFKGGIDPTWVKEALAKTHLTPGEAVAWIVNNLKVPALPTLTKTLESLTLEQRQKFVARLTGLVEAAG